GASCAAHAQQPLDATHRVAARADGAAVCCDARRSTAGPHAAQAMLPISVLAFALGCLPQSSAPERFLTYAGGDGPGAGKHVVLVAGDEEYRSEEALPMLARLLAVHHGFRCTVLFATDRETGAIEPKEQTHVPGLEAVDDADLLVLFLRFRE